MPRAMYCVDTVAAPGSAVPGRGLTGAVPGRRGVDDRLGADRPGDSRRSDRADIMP